MFVKLTMLLAMTSLSSCKLSHEGQGPISELDPNVYESGQKIVEFIESIDVLGPGYGFVLVTEDDVVVNYAEGLRNYATGEPLTIDTPMYIASQTKSYTGLLASILHQEGVLDLGTPLATYWPEEHVLPGDVDLEELTLRDLLTHQFPVRAAYVNIIEANVTRIRIEDFPRLISQYGVERDPGFRYDNIGYNLYGAILEMETGKPWQDWLEERVFQPLNLDRTSARTSDFTLDELAFSHIWLGPDEGFFPVPPKTDDVMHSAGGIVTSTSDMASYLQAQLRGEGPVGSGITSSMFALAQAGMVGTGERSPWVAEVGCSHYSLGWNNCDYEGFEFSGHSGGYTGSRSTMIFSKDMGIGAAVFSNSDQQTGLINGLLLNLLLHYVTEAKDADEVAERYYEEYTSFVFEEIELGHSFEERRLANEFWGGNEWQPSREELDEYSGRWVTGDPYQDLEFVINENGNPMIHWYDYVIELTPATKDTFGGRQYPLEAFEVFRFNRNENGELETLRWSETNYTRVE